MKAIGVVFIAAVGCVACAPVATVSGGAMLNVQPASNIPIAGAYDFDLLGPVRGDACVRSAAASDKPMEYWVGTLPFASTLPKDSLTAGAIAAASTDAIDRVAGADTLVLTRVVTEGKSPDEVCAYVYGRAVRLRKARSRAEAGDEVEDDEDDDSADDSDDDDDNEDSEDDVDDEDDGSSTKAPARSGVK